MQVYMLVFGHMTTKEEDFMSIALIHPTQTTGKLVKDQENPRGEGLSEVKYKIRDSHYILYAKTLDMSSGHQIIDYRLRIWIRILVQGNWL